MQAAAGTRVEWTLPLRGVVQTGTTRTPRARKPLTPRPWPSPVSTSPLLLPTSNQQQTTYHLEKQRRRIYAIDRITAGITVLLTKFKSSPNAIQN